MPGTGSISPVADPLGLLIDRNGIAKRVDASVADPSGLIAWGARRSDARQMPATAAELRRYAEQAFGGCRYQLGLRNVRAGRYQVEPGLQPGFRQSHGMDFVSGGRAELVRLPVARNRRAGGGARARSWSFRPTLSSAASACRSSSRPSTANTRT